jgi:hypothetical protein
MFRGGLCTLARETFSTPEHVAAVSGIRNSTACNWWNEKSRASGDAVQGLFIEFPHMAIWSRDQCEGR